MTIRDCSRLEGEKRVACGQFPLTPAPKRERKKSHAQVRPDSVEIEKMLA